MKTRSYIYILPISLACGVLFWITDAILDYYIFYEGTFSELLITNVPPHELFIRIIVIVFFIISGFIISGLISITKYTEMALEEYEKRYKTLFENAADAIFIHDPEGHFIEINRVACERLGYNREELLQMTLGDLDTLDYADIARDRINEILKNGDGIFETVHVKRDGNIIPIEINARLIDYEGKTAIISIARDISKRIHAEHALLETEKRFADFLDNSPAIIYLKDTENRYTMINRRFETTFGITNEQIAGKTDHDIFPKEISNVYFANDKKVMKSMNPMEFQEVIPVKNEPRTYISIKFPILDFAGKLTGICGISTDISNRKKLESQLIQSQKMETVARLAGGIAHDFNNILTAIMGNTEFVLMSLSHDDPSYPDIEEIMKASTRASALTGQLLTFSRHQIIKPRIINLNTVLYDIDKMLCRLIGEDIELVTIPCDGLWSVIADPSQIEQIISNLVINSRDSMPDGGKIIIETRNVTLDEEYARYHANITPGEYIMLSVSDTGTGIDEETKSKIFEPFFTTKEKGKGTGLGLSTCYGIVKQSGGHIWVYSEPNQGTTFKIYLPCFEGVPDNQESFEEFEKVPGGDETILLVEDEPIVRKIASRVLSKKGYHVLEASNGDDALRIIDKAGDILINLLITDIIMPKMGGYELSEIIKIQLNCSKVLYFTGYTENHIFDKGILKPDSPLLQKPFTPSELALKVRTILDS